MSLDVAVATSPYERIANKPFSLAWTLASDDGTENGAPENLSDVTEATVTAELRVDRGASGDSKTWTKTGGKVDLSQTLTINAVAYPLLIVTEATGIDAGTWDLKVALTRGGGIWDFVLKAILVSVEQPS